MVVCPSCNRIILVALADGGFKLRTRMLLLNDGKAVAVCPSCKLHVPVPVCIDSSQEIPKYVEKIVVTG